jgi:uncharacterized protein (TIGR02118 family)
MSVIIENARSLIKVPRRSALSLGLAAVAGMAGGAFVHAAGSDGGIKLTVLYGTPKDPAQFEKYYAETHMPMVYAVKEIKRTEVAMGLPGPGDAPPPFYRIFEAWFDSPEHLKQVTGTAQWKKIGDDVPNFASGGATVLISKIG